MKGPTETRAGPKRKRRLQQRRSQGLKLRGTYNLLAASQVPFASVFWAFEQRKGKLADKLANEGIEL